MQALLRRLVYAIVAIVVLRHAIDACIRYGCRSVVCEGKKHLGESLIMTDSANRNTRISNEEPTDVNC